MVIVTKTHPEIKPFTVLASGRNAGDQGARSPEQDLLLDIQKSWFTIQVRHQALYLNPMFCFYHYILYRFFEFTQTLKRSPFLHKKVSIKASSSVVRIYSLTGGMATAERRKLHLYQVYVNPLPLYLAA